MSSCRISQGSADWEVSGLNWGWLSLTQPPKQLKQLDYAAISDLSEVVTCSSANKECQSMQEGNLLIGLSINSTVATNLD